MESYRELANEFVCWIIEDACHSPGGYFYNKLGEKILSGSGKYADLSIFSFHPVKHIAAGEGGMITTNDEKLYNILLNLRTHGIQQDPSKKHENHGFWYYEMQSLGFNYRLTDFQAALGLSQLNRADDGLKKRIEIANRYTKAFRDLSYIKHISGDIEGHAYHLYILQVEKRKELFNYLREKNIFAQVHYIPAHLMPYYKDFGWKLGDMPFAEKYYENCISIPIFPSLLDEEQDFVINTIKQFYADK
jgi:dTDP-4-amino-4,6-dideoxygalactose transaminase